MDLNISVHHEEEKIEPSSKGDLKELLTEIEQKLEKITNLRDTMSNSTYNNKDFDTHKNKITSLARELHFKLNKAQEETSKLSKSKDKQQRIKGKSFSKQLRVLYNRNLFETEFVLKIIKEGKIGSSILFEKEKERKRGLKYATLGIAVGLAAGIGFGAGIGFFSLPFFLGSSSVSGALLGGGGGAILGAGIGGGMSLGTKIDKEASKSKEKVKQLEKEKKEKRKEIENLIKSTDSELINQSKPKTQSKEMIKPKKWSKISQFFTRSKKKNE